VVIFVPQKQPINTFAEMETQEMVQEMVQEMFQEMVQEENRSYWKSSGKTQPQTPNPKPQTPNPESQTLEPLPSEDGTQFQSSYTSILGDI